MILISFIKHRAHTNNFISIQLEISGKDENDEQLHSIVFISLILLVFHFEIS